MKKQTNKTVQPSSGTESAPREFGVPVTGFDDKGAAAPEGAGVQMGAAGPGVSNTRAGIH